MHCNMLTFHWPSQLFGVELSPRSDATVHEDRKGSRPLARVEADRKNGAKGSDSTVGLLAGARVAKGKGGLRVQATHRGHVTGARAEPEASQAPDAGEDDVARRR